jgi:hypothetical protein
MANPTIKDLIPLSSNLLLNCPPASSTKEGRDQKGNEDLARRRKRRR